MIVATNIYKQSNTRSIYYYIYYLGLKGLSRKLYKLFEGKKETPKHSAITFQEILTHSVTKGYFDGGRLKLA